MKRRKFTEQQMVDTLKQAESGMPVEQVCRMIGISDTTFYNWRKRYRGLHLPEVQRLKQLEDENIHLKKLVADLSLDKLVLQNVLAQKIGDLQAHVSAGDI